MPRHPRHPAPWGDSVKRSHQRYEDFRDANPRSGHVKDEVFRSALSVGLPIGGALQDAGWTCLGAERWYRRQGDLEMSRMLGRHVRAFGKKG